MLNYLLFKIYVNLAASSSCKNETSDTKRECIRKAEISDTDGNLILLVSICKGVRRTKNIFHYSIR